MPLMTRRSSTRGLPRVSRGRCGLSRANWSFVSQKYPCSKRGFLPETLNHANISLGIPFMGPGPRLSASRSISVDGFTKDLQYWLLCFSTELDSRLLDEFSGGQSNVYGYFVLFDIEKFHRRLSEAIHSIEINCGRVNVEYYDEHLPPMDLTSVIGNKPFRFAYQRELRFFICGEESKIHSMPQLCLRAAIMSDIAGVYNSTGEKEAGFGPIRLFPKSY